MTEPNMFYKKEVESLLMDLKSIREKLRSLNKKPVSNLEASKRCLNKWIKRCEIVLEFRVEE